MSFPNATRRKKNRFLSKIIKEKRKRGGGNSLFGRSTNRDARKKKADTKEGKGGDRSQREKEKHFTSATKEGKGKKKKRHERRVGQTQQKENRIIRKGKNYHLQRTRITAPICFFEKKGGGGDWITPP